MPDLRAKGSERSRPQMQQLSHLDSVVVHLPRIAVRFVRPEPRFEQVLVETVAQCANRHVLCMRRIWLDNLRIWDKAPQTVQKRDRAE